MQNIVILAGNIGQKPETVSYTHLRLNRSGTSSLAPRVSLMTEHIRFRCSSCGHRFEAEVLNEDERRETRREIRPTNALFCIECHRTEIQRGWN